MVEEGKAWMGEGGHGEEVAHNYVIQVHHSGFLSELS